jgi:glycosyltransferase involved in cell wall biosynthesis
MSGLPRNGIEDPRDDGGRDCIQLVSVGRAVNKKGYDILLQALGQLHKGLNWRLVHIGGGELMECLVSQAKSLGIDDKVQWLGPQSFDQVLLQYRPSDIFVLASRIDSDGDRDGIPNVLMEAMSQGLPCIATDISGIPELIQDQLNGVIVEPENVAALAQAITELIRSPEKRRILGASGYETVTKRFSMDMSIGQLIERFN